MPSSRYLTAAFYKFVALPDYVQRQAPLLELCQQRNVKGTILLAAEGINSTIAGAPDDIHAVLAYLRQDPLLADLEHKESWAKRPPFNRMKVRLKREIVTMGVPGVDPTRMAGTYVKPQDWNALIADPDVVLIDTRNDYEVAIGSFAGAIDPHIRTFGELPAWVEQAQALQAHRIPTIGDLGEIGRKFSAWQQADDIGRMDPAAAHVPRQVPHILCQASPDHVLVRNPLVLRKRLPLVDQIGECAHHLLAIGNKGFVK